MTLVRTLAVKITGLVVRFASPGAKEWAEGLALEIGYVDNDWSALAWALGSLRVLLGYREAPLASLRDVPAAAAKFHISARPRPRTFGWIFVLNGALYLWTLDLATTARERAGCTLHVLSMVVAGIIILASRSLKDAPGEDSCFDLIASAHRYRTELERRCYIQRIAACAFFVCIVTDMLAVTDGRYVHAMLRGTDMFVICLTAIAFALRTNRRRIERLDALLTERS